MPVMVLLFGFLLYPVAALPAGSQPKALPVPPLSWESQLPILSPLSCRNLTPESLPNFNHLDPLPRYLTSLALYITLEQAGCPSDAHALRQQLYRLGGVKATETLIQQLQGLQGNRRKRKSDGVLFSILQLLGRRAKRSGRASRSLSTADCVYEKERQVHSVMQFLPQVGSYYNLGTAFYYAAQDCTAQAWERGQEAALDLSYDFLVGLMGTTVGPAGVMAGLALKPAVKSGVQRLIEYYYSNKQGSGSPLPATDQSWQDWRTTTEMSSSWEKGHGVSPTTGSGNADEVTQATSLWNWGSFKIWG
ncbi:apolipoprotein F [Trichosurus vulpecula]|uniref:apolipoprotein F n=1 Tax=Trichosurus vulpecula TaxID=9337 RepID=UPI00186B3562|nr:apolipoprotein F [Trichosurus vulpecula]XP_036614975.1 apolipoprotein F [Trichosurus vulpecula]